MAIYRPDLLRSMLNKNVEKLFEINNEILYFYKIKVNQP